MPDFEGQINGHPSSELATLFSQVLLASSGIGIQEKHQHLCFLAPTQALKWNKLELAVLVLLFCLQFLKFCVVCNQV